MYGVRAVTLPTFVSTCWRRRARFASMPSTQLTRRVRQALRHPLQALHDAVGDDRLEGVELELARLGRHRHRHVGAGDREGDLVDHLGDHRVDLAGHDRRAGLARRQRDLADAGLRPRREQAQVVADLRELDGAALERAAEGHEDAGVARGLDQVGGGDELDARQLAEVAADGVGVLRVGGDARADGRGAEVDLAEQRHDVAEALRRPRRGCGRSRTNSWPRVIGTASCSCVRPTFSTSWNSAPFVAKAVASRSSSSSRLRSVSTIAILTRSGTCRSCSGCG